MLKKTLSIYSLLHWKIFSKILQQAYFNVIWTWSQLNGKCNLSTCICKQNITLHQPPDDVTCIAWNRQVQHILASTYAGRCVVWDLRKNEPIIKVSDSMSRVSNTSPSAHLKEKSALEMSMHLLGCLFFLSWLSHTHTDGFWQWFIGRSVDTSMKCELANRSDKPTRMAT